MSTTSELNENNTTPLNTALEAKWERLEMLQNLAAKRLRQHDAGKEVAAEQVFIELQKLLDEGQAEQIVAMRQDVASGEIDYWGHVSKRKITASTGLGRLNDLLGGGLESQRLMVLLGAPGGGKTTLANQIAVHTASLGRPVLYLTSEDMPFTLLAKTLARIGKIPYNAVLKGYEEKRAAIQAAYEAYQATTSATLLRYYDATIGCDLEQIRACARAHFEAYKDGGQGILVVDYLQRIARGSGVYRSSNGDIRQAVTIIAEQLRSIASELNCCVLALASQNRASGYGAGNNSLSSAKESGDIEYTADVMMALGEDTDRIATTTWLAPRVLKIDKNRQGATGSIKLDWYGERQQFTEFQGDGNDDSDRDAVPISSRKRGVRS